MIYIINGPNLNLLGTREPEIYGTENFESFLEKLQEHYPKEKLQYFQSNVEGELVNYIQQAGENATGIIINAAAYSHTSVAIADAVKAVKLPTVEVHISNVFAREAYRHHSFLSSVCTGVICGLGLEGYQLALDFLIKQQS